jgi:hypothetical protein
MPDTDRNAQIDPTAICKPAENPDYPWSCEEIDLPALRAAARFGDQHRRGRHPRSGRPPVKPGNGGSFGPALYRSNRWCGPTTPETNSGIRAWIPRFHRHRPLPAALDEAAVAVRAAAISQPERAFRTLGVADSDRFPSLVDSEHRASCEFGCYDDGPLHGLFVIDRGKISRARYRDPRPFGDNGEVVRWVRQMSSTSAESTRTD